MTTLREAAPPIASQADWESLVADLPNLISRLVDAEAFGAANPPVSSERGIYLFSEGSRHLYVGRTSITARSRQGNKVPSTSFSQPERVSDWWKLRKEDSPPDFFLVFQAAKEFIRKELEFRHVALEDDLRGVRSHVSEVYADVTLQTEFGDFSTS